MVRHHYLRSTLLIALMMSAAIADAAQRQGPASRPGGAVRGAARESGSTGDGRESLDDLAAEAEKKNSWPEASVAYYQASIQARVTGQYQKAISFGNKAIEMGERAGSPLLQARAIFPLVYSYRYLGQKAQVRPLLQKGIEIVKQMPAGGAKQSVEANLYRELGVEFSLAGETQKAIETMSYSLQVLDSFLSFLQRRAT